MVSLMAGRLWLSVLLWNLLWLILLWATAFLFFESWLPERPPELVALGLGMLLFFSFGLLKVHLSTWVHPSWPRFEDLALPFIRPFFPQVAIPLLLAYLGVQIKWLHTRQSHLLLGMVILQLTALAMFPYTTLMMAMITATIASEEILRCPRTPLSWSLLWYAIACGAADGIFFFRGRGLSSQSLAPVRLDFSAAHHVLGGVWALIAVLTLATALTRALPGPAERDPPHVHRPVRVEAD